MIEARSNPCRSSRGGRTRVLRLGEDATRDPLVAGVKAASLAELTAAGLPVPPGIVIPAGARDFLGSLLGWYDSLGPAEPVAVRLSPVSGAVPFAARVGVRGVRELLVAVRDAMRAAGATGESHPILLQSVLRADASGVLRPQRADRDGPSRHLILAVAGPGGDAGEPAAEEIVLDARTGLTISGPLRSGSLLPSAERRRLSTVATRVERILGGPREIGWAIRGESILLLSARLTTGTRSARPGRPSPFERSYEEARREARARTAVGGPRRDPLRTLRAFVSGPADVRAFRLRTVPAHRKRVRDLELRIARVRSVAEAAAVLRDCAAACFRFEADSCRVSGRAGHGPVALRRAASLLLHHPALARERRSFREARDSLRERSASLVHLALAALGERLAGEGALRAATDVTLLTLGEASGADRADFARFARPQVLARRAEELVAGLPPDPGTGLRAWRGTG